MIPTLILVNLRIKVCWRGVAKKRLTDKEMHSFG
jgi:hypothetical protein